MIYQADDLIGDSLGLGSKVNLARLKKNIGKFRRFVKKATGKGAAVAASVSASPESAPVVVETATGGVALDFVKKNPIAIAGVGLLAVLLFVRKKR